MKGDARWQGTIAYYEGSAAMTGREQFQIRRHDGHRTLQATCEFFAQGLVRTCQLDLFDGGAEAFVRIDQHGQWLGSGRYGVTPGHARAALFGPTGDARETLEGPLMPFFGTHSLINDGWFAALFDGPRDDQGRRHPGRAATCSHQGDGGGVPILGASEAWSQQIGTRERRVAAGTFACTGWRVGYGQHPPLDVWVTGDDAIMVALIWPAFGYRYELTALTRP